MGCPIKLSSHFPYRGLVDTGEVVPSAVVVVGHDVEPVNVGVDLVQFVSIVGLVRIGSCGKSEKVRWVVLLEGFAHLLHQSREMLLVLRICGYFGQHVIGRELPVEVNPVKSKVVHEMDCTLDECLSSFPCLGHVGEDPSSSSPAADRKENFQVWVFLLQCNGSSKPIMMTIVKTPLCDAARCPNIPVPLLDAVLDRLLTKVHWTHVKPGIPSANFIGVVEDIAKAVVNHITEAYINVLRPKLPQSRSKSIVSAKVEMNNVAYLVYAHTP